MKGGEARSSGKRVLRNNGKGTYRRRRQDVKCRKISVEGRQVDEDVAGDLRALIVHDARRLKNIATKADLHPQTLSKLMYGDTRNPSSRTVFRILKACGISCFMATKN